MSALLLPLPSSLAASIAGKLLRVEVSGPGPAIDERLPNTSTLRSLWGPPSPPHQTLTNEGPAQPALRRFRGIQMSIGGPMPPPK
jgi:hypothetical protein